jgi:hypothetical protein
MSTTTRLSGSIAALTIAATLAVTGTAGAKAGEHNFQQTYPFASRLCAHVQAGKGPVHLRRFAAQVLADCATLNSGFTAAQSAVLAAQTTFANGLAADRAAIAAACTPPVKNHPLCRSTRRRPPLLHHRRGQPARLLGRDPFAARGQGHSRGQADSTAVELTASGPLPPTLRRGAASVLRRWPRA